MFRAIITIIAMSLIVLFFGLPTFLVSLVYPSRRMMALCSWVWAVAVLRCAGVRLTIEGREHLRDNRPRFYMGNHQSALDIPIVLAALRGDVRFMAKNTLFHIPIFGWIIHRFGYVPIHRGNARTTLGALEKMLERLRRSPVSFAVFPEGTRSRDGRLLTFRRGTMKVAQRSGLDVVPFSIEGSVAVHHRDHLLRAIPGPVRLVFAKPIPTAEVAAMSSTDLHRRLVETVARQLGQSIEVAPPVDDAEESPLALIPSESR